MRKFFRNLMYSGIADRLGPEDRVKLLFINSIIFFGLAVLGVFAGRDLAHGQYLLGGVTLGVCLVIVGLFFAIRITKGYQVGAWFFNYLTFGFFTYLTASGGANSTVVLWLLTYPVISIFLVGAVWGSLHAGVFLAIQAVLFFLPGFSPIEALDIEFKLRLVGAYIILFSCALAFETIRVRIQAELTKTAAALAAAKVQTDGILTNVNEGIFLLDEGLTFSDQHSRSLAALLDLDNPAGRSFLDTLRGRIGERDLTAAEDYLEMFFLPDPPWHLMEDINPLAEVSLAGPDGSLRHLTFAFSKVELSTGGRILGTIRDETQARELGRKLKEEEDRSARQMRHLFQIIHVKPELLLQFLQDADEEIAAINRRLKDPQGDPAHLVEDLFQGVHAVKGNAALVGLSSFAHRVHDLETLVSRFRGTKPSWQDFLEMTVGLSVIQAELTEVRDLLGRMSAFQKGLESSDAGRDLLLMALEKAVERLGRDSGRDAVLDTSGFRSEAVPERYRRLIKDILVQLVRNSFAHGLEAADERRTAGKPVRPRIKVTAAPSGSQLVLAYWDDGRGFNLAKLRESARRLSPERDLGSLTEAEVLDLAFAPGLSTAAGTDLNAGRGVGLSLVKERIVAAGGTVRLRSVPGRGVAFDITLPMA